MSLNELKYSFIKQVSKMVISYKTILHILPLQMASLYNIAVALNLEWLYNKTSDLGIYYEKCCQIFTNFDKCTLCNVHVVTSKCIAKMLTVKCAAFLNSIKSKNACA